MNKMDAGSLTPGRLTVILTLSIIIGLISSTLGGSSTSNSAQNFTSSLTQRLTTPIQITLQPGIIKPKIDVKNYTIQLKIRTSETFRAELINNTSELYQNYTKASKTVLNELYKNILGFNAIVIKSFSNGSVICHYEVLFNLRVTSRNGITATYIHDIIIQKIKLSKILKNLPGDFDVAYFDAQMTKFSKSDAAKRLTDPCFDACSGHSQCEMINSPEVIKCSCKEGFKGEDCRDVDSTITVHDRIIIIVSSVCGAIALILIVMICMCLCNRNKHKGSSQELYSRDSLYWSRKWRENSFMKSKNRAYKPEADRAWRSMDNNFGDRAEQKVGDMDRRYEKPSRDSYEMVYSPSRSIYGRHYDTTQRPARDFDETDLQYKQIRDPYSHSGELMIYQPTRSPRVNADLRVYSDYAAVAPKYQANPYEEQRHSREV
ncbi:hypothetical protein LOTGIDRAFT_238708 [Lottia gigantea]|uniref:EGF-like domain-containing protein n=1 Tax=Lottia gigantea TaxID=225164 RepID=V4AXN7_LOTGI|nr:hypothetical protein LOTGIDRAFT_238708 [Lottia gigantea]ESO99810.1 hypothetical protein LOTGIDRAFT_238708 [Lottia gigantea]